MKSFEAPPSPGRVPREIDSSAAPASRPPVLVVGPGFVGRRLCELLHEEGCSVLAARRNPQTESSPWTCQALDVTTGRGLDELPESVQSVVYSVSPADSTLPSYHSVYQEGLKRVLTRYRQARILLISSTRVYGERAPSEELTEESPLVPCDPQGACLAEAETLLRSHPGGAVVLRASGIYGPGRRRLLQQLLSQRLSAEDKLRVQNRIHRDDLAQIALFVLARPELCGPLVCTDPSRSTAGEFQDWLQEMLQLSPQELPTSAEPSLRERKAKRLYPKRLLELGFEFQFPSFREGYLDEVRRLQEDRKKAHLPPSFGR